MKICVLNPSYEGSDSPFKGHDPLCDPSRWAPEHEWDRCLIEKKRAGAQIRDLVAKGYDLFFNLCDGAWDEDRAGIDVVRLLEDLKVPFTGATSRFYEPSRAQMKLVCRYYGVGTPEHVFAKGREELEIAAKTMRFPMIVKHPSSYGSIGMTKKSRVEGPEALLEEGLSMIQRYGGALIEEFIEGDEYTCLVAENPADPEAPRHYPSIQIQMPPGETFKHFDLKWVDYDGMKWVRCADEALDMRIREATAALFAGLRGTGYGRADVRVDREGRVFVLEINPNCGIFYPEGHYGSADEILGLEGGHSAFVRLCIEAALQRHRDQTPAFELRFTPGRGYDLVARRDIAEGEVVERGEEKPHPLVSKSWVDRRWSGRKKKWFAEYAWPLTDEVHVMWSEDPDDWRPINHGCDPNCWMTGLDLVARRAIARGEPLTVDYATFCGPEMASFPCSCGSPACRGTIEGRDGQGPAVGAYGDHVSDYVRSWRRSSRRDD